MMIEFNAVGFKFVVQRDCHSRGTVPGRVSLGSVAGPYRLGGFKFSPGRPGGPGQLRSSDDHPSHDHRRSAASIASARLLAAGRRPGRHGHRD
jgi:hypothetical protein